MRTYMYIYYDLSVWSCAFYDDSAELRKPYILCNGEMAISNFYAAREELQVCRMGFKCVKGTCEPRLRLQR